MELIDFTFDVTSPWDEYEIKRKALRDVSYLDHVHHLRMFRDLKTLYDPVLHAALEK